MLVAAGSGLLWTILLVVLIVAVAVFLLRRI